MGSSLTLILTAKNGKIFFVISFCEKILRRNFEQKNIVASDASEDKQGRDVLAFWARAGFD